MMTERIGRPVEILLVEDNPGDVRLTTEALKDAKAHSMSGFQFPRKAYISDFKARSVEASAAAPAADGAAVAAAAGAKN